MSKGAFQPCQAEDGSCCAPVIGRVAVANPDGAQILFPDGFIDLGVLPNGPSLLQFAMLKLGDMATAEVRRYPPPAVPTGPPDPSVIAGPTVTQVAGAMDDVRLTLNKPGGLGGGEHWELVFTNACGCCAVYHLEVGVA